MNKSIIRKIYKQRRLDLRSDEVQKKSSKIANNFIKNLLPKITDFEKKTLAFYFPTNNEVDTIFLIQHCQKLGNEISLPKIKPSSLVLEFKSHKIGDNLVYNKTYSKILEPKDSKPNIVPDIIFMPLVAFDNNCHRIGMGGGFYDAYIKHSRHQNTKKIFIGLAYDMQNCEEIKPDKWDQSLDFIVSENIIVPYKQ
ncbi:MAG: 5-formyltetrahydrofolate cyclo-ligase [Rickettsiales bacterium]|jgi:5-formyltetrahydrofolate cyclo-ligase